MKTKYFSIHLLLLLGTAAMAAPAVTVITDTNGTLLAPLKLFKANSNEVNAVVRGTTGGGIIIRSSEGTIVLTNSTFGAWWSIDNAGSPGESVQITRGGSPGAALTIHSDSTAVAQVFQGTLSGPLFSSAVTNTGAYYHTNAGRTAEAIISTNAHIRLLDEFGGILETGTNWFRWALTNGHTMAVTNGILTVGYGGTLTNTIFVRGSAVAIDDGTYLFAGSTNSVDQGTWPYWTNMAGNQRSVMLKPSDAFYLITNFARFHNNSDWEYKFNSTSDPAGTAANGEGGLPVPVVHQWVNPAVTAMGTVIATNGVIGNGAMLTNMDATQLTAGTVPDARFPSTLPAASGANLTTLSASQLSSGTVPDGRFPGQLPRVDGVNVSNVVNVYEQSRSSGFHNLRHFMTNLMDGTKPMKALIFTDQAPADQYPGSVIWRAAWAGLLGLNGGIYATGGADGDMAMADSGGSTVTDTAVWNFNGGLRQIGAGNTRTFYRYSSSATPGITTSNFWIDTANVFYIRETNAGTFAIDTNKDGAGWGIIKTIDASSWGTNGFATNISLVPGYYSLRVRGLSGTCRVIGAQEFYSATNSYCGGGWGMSSPAGTKESFLDVPTNIVWPIFSAIHPNLILYLDTLGTAVPPYTPANVPDQFNFFVTNTMPEADVIWIGSHWDGSSSLATFETANLYMRQKCQQFGWAFFDSSFYMGTNFAACTNMGLIQVNGHIDTPGCRYLDNRIWHELMMNMAILNGGHMSPAFQGSEANLFNNGRTNYLGAGTATPTERFTVATAYGSLRFGEPVSQLPGFWADVNGTIGTTDTGNNLAMAFGADGSMYLSSPIHTTAELIFGHPNPNAENGRMWGARGFSVGSLNNAVALAGGAVRGPGQGVISAEQGYYFCATTTAGIPPAPKTSGDSFLWNSNGYMWMIVSTNGGGGVSSSWKGTNKVGW